MKSQSKLIAASITVFIFILCSINPATANAKSTASINETMVNIGHTMEGIFPIIFDNEKPDKKDQKKLKKSTEKLSKLFKNAKPHIDAKSPTYRISFEVIETQLSQALSAIKYKNFDYTKSILNDFTSICTTCHTQDPKLRSLFPNVKRESFGSDYNYAEFNYMTRNYQPAIDYYNKHLKNVSKINEAELLSIMKRMMTIYLQVDYRPDDAIEQLSNLKNYKLHTKFSRKTLNEWLSGLAELKKNSKKLPTINNIDQLNVHVNKILGDLHEPGSAQFPNKRERISRIWLRGVLYHYLNTEPSREETPIILYWLAIIDRSINFSLYYSLADMYLKECILQYTSHPYAKKCFDEYEAYVTMAYSGSRGTDIPEDIQDELKALRIRVHTAPK